MSAHFDPSSFVYGLALLIGAYYLAVAAFRWACGYLALAQWRAAIPDAGDRCPGEGHWDGAEFHWMEGCDDCRRRTAVEGPVTVRPPRIITFECHYRLAP